MNLKSSSNQNLAQERINTLLTLAKDKFDKNTALSNRYVTLARKIAMRYKIKFSREQKLTFCKKCNTYMKVGTNQTRRIRNNRLIITCLNCKAVRRIIFSKK